MASRTTSKIENSYPSGISYKETQTGIDPLLMTIGHVLFISFAVSGFLGSIWVSDDLDPIKLPLVVMVAVPVFTFLYGFRWLHRGWHKKWPRTWIGLFVVVFVTLSFGNVSLLNALIGDNKREKVTIPIKGDILVVAKKRGSLGMLYQERW